MAGNTVVRFAHLCDLAFFSEERKLSIIGTFDKVWGPAFPLVHPKFSVAISLVLSHQKGNHNFRIKFLDPEGRRVGSDLEYRIEVTDDAQNINFIGDLINVTFVNPGDYKIVALLDDEPVHEIKLIAEVRN